MDVLMTAAPESDITLAKRLTMEARDLPGVQPHHVDFPDLLTPTRADDGDIYVYDQNNVVKYNLSTGELSRTDAFIDAYAQFQQTLTNISMDSSPPEL